MKLFFSSLFKLLTLVFGLIILLSSCTDWYHYTTYQGAFFLSDSTLGVIGWQYDMSESGSTLASTETENVYQYYYEYNLNTTELKTVTILQSDIDKNTGNGIMAFRYPLIYYYTYPNKGNIGALNINTLENKIITSENGYSGSEALTISNKGRYLGYRISYPKSPYYRFSILDLTEIKDIANFMVEQPLYIDEDSLKVIMLSPSNTQKWIVLYDIQSKVIDTLSENTFGIFHYYIRNDKAILNSNDNVWKYIDNIDLLNGNFNFHDITTQNIGAFDINFNKGYSVFTGDGGSVHFVNYGDSLAGVNILEYSKVEK